MKRTDVLDGLARSLLATEQCDLLSRFVTHTLALPNLYPLTTLPTSRRWRTSGPGSRSMSRYLATACPDGSPRAGSS